MEEQKGCCDPLVHLMADGHQKEVRDPRSSDPRTNVSGGSETNTVLKQCFWCSALLYQHRAKTSWTFRDKVKYIEQLPKALNANSVVK